MEPNLMKIWSGSSFAPSWLELGRYPFQLTLDQRLNLVTHVTPKNLIVLEIPIHPTVGVYAGQTLNRVLGGDFDQPYR
jgi:hypothetical protein